jgi:membrane protease YdiL (CAAX protease family)/NAD-dependent dihydropyrimidine dehydrogenase PreA subunit
MSPARATPLRLDAPACDGCRRCLAACRAHALKVGPGYIYVDWEKCDGCGTCAAACDRGAIQLKRGAPATDAARPTVSPATAAKVPAAPAWLPAAFRDRGASALTGSPTAPNAPTAAKAAPAADAPPWGIAEGALVLVVAIALLVGVQLLGAGATAPAISLVAYDLVLAAVVAVIAARHPGGLWHALRLDRLPEVSSVLLAVLAGVGCWGFQIAYRLAAMGLGVTPPVADGPNLTSLFGPGVLGAGATLLVVGLLGPLVEEAAFRGVLTGSVRGRFGVAVAIVAPALVFALLHASVWSFIPLTVLGLALGWLSVRSRSLWPAIVAHVIYNAVFVATALYVVARG